MRGIAGWATTLPRTAPDDAVLVEMVGAVSHRTTENLSAVLDRNPRRQVVLGASLADAQSRISLVLDGSILNFDELKSLLVKRGYQFKSNTHEELLLRAYQQWDKDVVKQLRGAFALAIWDARKERLLLARDRFGEKPLYLHERPSRLFFASEAKALLKVPGIDARVDMRAFWDCLASHYVPGPRTLFEGIRKLPPATYATWQLGRLQEVRYWTPPDKYRFSNSDSEEDQVEQFVEKLEEAVRLRAGDGVLLSGGLDSAAMVAVLAKNGRSVRTFTLGFEGDPKTELPAAAEVAKQFGTQHQEIVVAPKDLVSGLAKLVQSRDAPATRPSELAVHHLAGVAGRSARTLLTGDGCDEVIGGYRRLIVPAYARWDMGREHEAREKIFAANVKAEEGKQPPFDVDPESSPLRKALYAGQTTWLPDELLERSDRAAALAGAEARLPYLDHRLAEYVSSLPDDRRVRGLATKWILREAGRRLIPSGVARRKKGGFRMPIRDWLRNELRDTLLEHLQGGGSRTRKYYDAARLDRVLDEHLRGKNNHARLLWTLLNLEIWHRSYRPA